jgi:hypothetical protein
MLIKPEVSDTWTLSENNIYDTYHLAPVLTKLHNRIEESEPEDIPGLLVPIHFSVVRFLLSRGIGHGSYLKKQLDDLRQATVAVINAYRFKPWELFQYNFIEQESLIFSSLYNNPIMINTYLTLFGIQGQLQDNGLGTQLQLETDPTQYTGVYSDPAVINTTAYLICSAREYGELHEQYGLDYGYLCTMFDTAWDQSIARRYDRETGTTPPLFEKYL